MRSSRKPALSIIIPTYNEEYYLPVVLRCLSEQSFQDFEIIVADNRSKDKTREIARRAGAKVCLGGLPAEGRNNGARVARAKLLLFLDADVRFSKNFLSESISEFHSRQLSAATARSIAHSTNLYDKAIFRCLNLFIFLTQKYLPVACGYCIFVTRTAFRNVNGFDKERLLQEDIDFVQKVARRGKFGLLQTIIQPSTRRFRVEGRLAITTKVVWTYLRGGAQSTKYDFKGYGKKTAREEKIIAKKIISHTR